MSLIQIDGGSMRPFLNAGDWVDVDWELRNAEVGSILLVRASDRDWIVHRLVGHDRKTGKMLVKGDASTVTDTLDGQQVWGVVVGVRALEIRKSSLDRAIAECSRRNWRKAVVLVGWLRRVSLWVWQ